MEKTMHQIKTISSEAVPRALQKAERYRLLNQSWATESICLDILKVDPGHQPARVMYLLSLTDQFGAEPGELARKARGELAHITDEYQRAYYAGIIDERLGHAKLAHGVMHAEGIARKLFLSAMESFQRAEGLRQSGNDDSILRWNTCARTLERLRLEEEPEVQHAPQFGE